MSVVTAHMVYFCAFARSEILKKKRQRNKGWVADSLIQASMGLKVFKQNIPILQNKGLGCFHMRETHTNTVNFDKIATFIDL